MLVWESAGLRVKYISEVGELEDKKAVESECDKERNESEGFEDAESEEGVVDMYGISNARVA
jgi:hypothetical protein